MATFFKANIASLLASLTDYLVFIFLIQLFKVDLMLATVIGTVSGGIVNFLVGRYWVFEERTLRVHKQALRYMIVWVGNLILNASGMYLFAKVWRFHYILSKILVSLAVGFGYNYVLQRNFVFKKAPGNSMTVGEID